tara:strand:- start:249 stop:527 length:279 start_codon:yes stop_codon:yes gene_type:complete
MKGNLGRDHRHVAGFASLAAEIVTIALLDYRRKRIGEETKTATRDGRDYANDLAKKESAQLRWFIFGGAMDSMLDLANLDINPDCIRKEIEE